MKLAEALVEVARKEAAAPKKEKRRPWNVANVRSGRRPMSVSTMMKKEKDGTLQVKIAEVFKTAITRSVKEWRAQAASGNQGTADQIARAHGELGLKPRYLENISGGGMEAGVDKMMGAAGGAPAGQAPNASGYVAKKLYKPDSPLTSGEDTSKLLQMKQNYTDTARSLSPAAKEMVPAMYGYSVLQGPGGQLRHTSEHEFVPGMTSLRRDPNAIANTQALHETVLSPMVRKGMPMADVPRVFNGAIGGNASNAQMTPSGPKMIDFLPQGAGAPAKVLKKGDHDLVIPATTGSGRGDTGYNKGNMNQLRRDVHRPAANYQPPSLSGAAAHAEAPSAVAPAASGAQTAVTNPVGPPTARTAVTAPVRTSTALAPTQLAPVKPLQGPRRMPGPSVQSAVGGAAGQLAAAPAIKLSPAAKTLMSGPAKALSLKPGGAMANVFSRAMKMASANPELIQALVKVAQFYGPIVPFTDQTDRGASPVPRSRLDKITSRENIENEPAKREDGRDFVAFENAPGTQFNEIAATNSPQERTASVNPVVPPPISTKQRFLHGAKQEIGPAIGMLVGAGLGHAYHLNELAASGAGYGGGALAQLAVEHMLKKKSAQVGMNPMRGAIANMGSILKGTSPLAAHANEVAGLGILAVPAADTLQAHLRSYLAGEGSHGAEKRQFIGEPGHALAEIGGLGVLAGPAVHGLLHHA